VGVYFGAELVVESDVLLSRLYEYVFFDEHGIVSVVSSFHIDGYLYYMNNSMKLYQKRKVDAETFSIKDIKNKIIFC